MVAITCSFVLCSDVENSVGIDLEGDLDLWDTTRGRWDASQVELSELVVVFCHRAFALIHLRTHAAVLDLCAVLSSPSTYSYRTGLLQKSQTLCHCDEQTFG